MKMISQKPPVLKTVRPLKIPGRDVDWQRALCKNADNPDRFHVDDYGDMKRITDEAIAMCNTPCPIKNECFIYGYENRLDGVWGGTTSRQRNQMRKKGMAA